MTTTGGSPEQAGVEDQEAFQNELRGLARGGLLNLTSNVASQLALFSLTILVARRLGREPAGVYFQSFAFLSLLSLVSLSGFRSGLTRYVAVHLANGDVPRMRGAIRLALAISVPVSFLLAAALFAAAPWLARSAFHDAELEAALRFVAAALPAVALQDCALSATQGFRTMKPFAFVGLLFEPFLRLALTSALLAADLDLHGVMLALTLSSWAGGIAAAVWLNRLIGRAIRSSSDASGTEVVVDAAPLLRYSAVAWVASLASTGLIWADTIILGVTVSSGEVGVYNAAARLVTLAVFVLNPINASFGPRIADLFERGQLELLRQTYTVATNWIVRLSLPAFAVLAALPGSLLELFFGSKFAVGATVTVILVVGQMFNAATGPCGIVINMSGRNRLSLIDNLAVLGLNVALNIVLIPRWGINGAAAAWAVSLAAVNSVKVIQVRSFLRTIPFEIAQAKALLAAVAGGAAAWATSRWLADGEAGTLLAVGAAVTVYLGLVVALGLPENDWVVGRAVTQRRPGRKEPREPSPIESS